MSLSNYVIVGSSIYFRGTAEAGEQKRPLTLHDVAGHDNIEARGMPLTRRKFLSI